MSCSRRLTGTRFAQTGDTQGTGVKGAVSDSIRLLSMQHAVRVGLSSKTRSELGGPFLKDYGSSIRMPRTWGDGDGWVINYLGHPSQGAASGWVWLQNEPGAERQKLGRSRRYWSSRGRALAWSAIYSTQFEIGPYSEASIGNVGLRPETTGWTDYVSTPIGGLAMIVAEDAIDQHLVTWLERHTNNEPLRAIVSLVHDAQPRDGQSRWRPLAVASHDPRSAASAGRRRKSAARARQRRRQHPK